MYLEILRRTGCANHSMVLPLFPSLWLDIQFYYDLSHSEYLDSNWWGASGIVANLSLTVLRPRRIDLLTVDE